MVLFQTQYSAEEIHWYHKRVTPQVCTQYCRAIYVIIVSSPQTSKVYYLQPVVWCPMVSHRRCNCFFSQAFLLSFCFVTLFLCFPFFSTLLLFCSFLFMLCTLLLHGLNWLLLRYSYIICVFYLTELGCCSIETNSTDIGYTVVAVASNFDRSTRTNGISVFGVGSFLCLVRTSLCTLV